MHLQTIVAFTDFSASAEHALDRAALVAASHGARLRIVYSTHTPDPRFVDPYARLEQRARQLARRHGVTVVAQDLGSGDVVEDALAAAAGADLLVLDRRKPQGWRALLRGSVLTRILRSSPCPVLVVQRAPQGSYQRKLVAVDFSDTSMALVRYAGGLEAEAQLQLYHAVDLRDEAKLRSAEASVQAVQAYRSKLLTRAAGRMLPLTSAYDARRNRVATAIGAGDPARELAVHHEATGADLIAVGYTRRPALIEWLVGTVAGRVVQSVQCDVLVFPSHYAQPPGTAARSGPAVRGLSA